MHSSAASLLGGDYLQGPADVNKHAESQSRLYDGDMGFPKNQEYKIWLPLKEDIGVMYRGT